jgi:hypothetical protein
MKLNPSLEADGCATAKILNNIARNQKAHYRIHKSSQPVPILNQANKPHNAPTIFMIYFNIIHPLKCWYSKRSLSL